MRILLTVIVPFKGIKKEIIKFISNHAELINKQKLINFLIVDSSDKELDSNYLENIEYHHYPNLSIYEALNYGILNTNTDYYLMMGADDILYKEIYETLGLIEQNNSDISTFPVKNCEKTLPFNNLRINHRNFVYQHSVSTIFKRTIHKRIGLYPTNFNISSDAFIILKAYKNKININKYLGPTIGEYGLKGISSRKQSHALFELSIICFKLGYIKSFIYYAIVYLLKR